MFNREFLSSPTVKGFLLSVLGYSFYSAMDTMIKGLSARYSVALIMFYFIIVAMGFVILVMVIKKRPLSHLLPRQPRIMFIRGFFAFISAWFAFEAFSLIPMATAYALIFVCPLFLTVMAGIFLKERITIPLLAALVAGFIGALVVLRPGFQTPSWGMISALLCALTYAINLLILRRFSSHESFWANIVCPELFTFTGAALLSANQLVIPLASDWLPLVLCGILSASGAIVITLSFYYAPASRVAAAHYIQILWGVFYGYLFWNDIPTIWVLSGSTLIIGSGLYIIHLNKRLVAA